MGYLNLKLFSVFSPLDGLRKNIFIITYKFMQFCRTIKINIVIKYWWVSPRKKLLKLSLMILMLLKAIFTTYPVYKMKLKKKSEAIMKS